MSRLKPRPTRIARGTGGNQQAEEVAEKSQNAVILSEAKNLSSI